MNWCKASSLICGRPITLQIKLFNDAIRMNICWDRACPDGCSVANICKSASEQKVRETGQRVHLHSGRMIHGKRLPVPWLSLPKNK
jgi:hypothetical protein